MATQDTKQEQLDIAARLQLKWLQHMERLIDDGKITSTDLATLGRLLASNGWNLDPAMVPKGLKDKLTQGNPRVFDDEDPDVIARIG